jgi:hypothetical protein
MEPIRHHQANRLRMSGRLIRLALVSERLYGLRCLHGGEPRVRSAMDLVGYFWLSLAGPIDRR